MREGRKEGMKKVIKGRKPWKEAKEGRKEGTTEGMNEKWKS